MESRTASITADVIAKVRSCVGVSEYEFFDCDCKPPRTVNCFNLLWWAFTTSGIVVPRDLKLLLYRGRKVHQSQALPGQLVFVAQPRGEHYVQDTDRAYYGVDHVGMIDSALDGTRRHCAVIHACANRNTVIAEPLSVFLKTYHFRGVYDIIGRSREP